MLILIKHGSQAHVEMKNQSQNDGFECFDKMVQTDEISIKEVSESEIEKLKTDHILQLGICQNKINNLENELKTFKNSSKRENRHGQDRNSVSKRSYDKLKDDLYKSERKISDYKIDIEDLIEEKR